MNLRSPSESSEPLQESLPPEPSLPTVASAGQMVAAPQGSDFRAGDPESPATTASRAGDSAATPSTGADARAGRQFLTGRAARSFDKSDVGQSPGRLAWRILKKNRLAMAGLWLLSFFYLCALLAPFVAPYGAIEDNPTGTGTRAGHPPMKLRWREADGTWHKRPFIYETVSSLDEDRNFIYLANPNRPYLVHWFVQGEPYRLLGLIPMRTHLFGVDEGAGIHILGTDQYGRDYFSRLLLGSQISLSVGLVAISISFTLGMLVGGISGFYGGRVDDIIMRGCEIMMSVPQFYLLLALAATLPPDLSPATTYLLITIILSFVGWAGMARIIRGMVLSVREKEYVEAARSMGASDFKIIVRHILPSTFTYAIVAATMSVPGYILGEAGLAFLNLGIRDPVPSWGNMLTDAQQSLLQGRLWIITPAVLIFLTTLAFNFLGDGLRDALDPKSARN